MRHNTPVTTLAAALALALLLGVLLPMDNVVHAADPEFGSDTLTREVPENTPPGVNIGAPISATDADEGAMEFGQTLTYSLGGTDAASFDIDASTGQLITKAPLDEETKASYSVTVTVDDGETHDPPITQDVTIRVRGVDEPPLAPVPPTVVSWDNPDTADTDESTTSLRVIWHPPENMGRPSITDYDVEYKRSTATSFESVDHTGSNTTATITGLEANTSYQVRVRAKNGDNDSTQNWSLVGTGSTNREDNRLPKFHEAEGSPVDRDVPENTPAGEDVDSPVTATDGDTASLTYGLEGPDADLFNFDTRSGQIRTKAPLNHEDARCGYIDGATPSTQCVYRVTVTVVDGAGGSDARAVDIEVDDRDEPASAPARPTVRPTEKSSTSLVVSWNPPDNTGRPPITGYDVQYRKGSDPFSNDNCRGADVDDNCNGITNTTTTITQFDPNTTYEVRVRTTNAERVSVWSTSGTGKTSKGNHQPIFDDRPHGGTGSERNTPFTVSRRVDENTGSGQNVGRVFADDEDNDRLTYKLDGDDADKFDINETTGQIRTKAGVSYNYEAIAETGTCSPLDEETVGSGRCYTVTVEVRDGLDNDRVEVEETNADDTITLKIGVRDREEAPERPAVTVTAPAGNTTLEVFWEAKNTGPNITSYDVQYRKGSAAFSNDNCRATEAENNCDNIPATTTTIITGLDADTPYSVQVRARNDEGVSDWSSPSPASVKTNKGTNEPPTFLDSASPLELDVGENASNRKVGNAVGASDDSSTSLTYSLGGRDVALFSIVPSSGQIQTRSSLNHEDQACGYDSTAQTTSCTYNVRVKVDDRAGGSVSKEVTITVNDRDEPPSAPSGLRVTATKDTGWSLDVTWNEPRNSGKPPITDYDIEYRKVGDADDPWQDWPHGTDGDGNTDTSATITRRATDEDAAPLEPRTKYEVRVRAKNGEGDNTENWSSRSQGTTGASNRRPSFDKTVALVILKVDENTRSGQNVGSAVSASDADGNRLTYTLEGPGKDSFSIVSSSGQIRTRSALDRESRQSYSVTMRVDDGQRKDNSSAAKSVTIMVDDVRETPPAPAAPRVVGIPGSTDSVRVTWDEPANAGPSIDEYEVRYSGGGLVNVRWPHNRVDRSTIITELESGTRYGVQVRARSDEGTSEWSRPGSGMPNPDVANRNPRFSGGSRSLSVPENEPAGAEVGAPIAATDQDGDTLTYTLEGADADSFDILSTSDGGQIRTSTALNHEEKSSYSVTVRVADGRGGTDAVNVTIRVTDVDGEAPATPFAPIVTAISSTSLQVSWEEPENTGPPITDYDHRYRDSSGSWTEVTNTTITGTTVTVDGLTPSTSYDVEVRAKNAEGTSDWSNPGNGATNAPGANNLPVFSDGTSATRSVSASAPAGTSIGLPVTATDADSGDTLTYSLEGRDAALFDINDATGQLLTKSGVTLIVDTYTVTVAADDGVDIARISVTINATAAPPNNPPVFTEGASAARIVSASAPAGTSIGAPLTATDADAGATLTYSIEGADGASFGINPANGQLLTVAGVTLDRTTYTVEVVANDGITNSRITVTITVTPNRAPVFNEGAPAARSVREDAASGTNIGNPVTATDADPGTTLTYRLEGTDAGSFTINTANGQIRTSAVLDASTKSTYTVDVVASDGSLEARITVTITVNALPTTFGCATRGAVSDASNTDLVSDCEALLQARNKLEGSARLDWSESTRIEQWEGVTISGTPMRVTGLNLMDRGLSGTIPDALGRLSMLTRLNLRSNPGLSGEIPDALGNLRNLRLLNLHSNSHTGAVPDLRGIAGLEELYLANNADYDVDGDKVPGSGLTGRIPTWLNGMTNMEELWLWGNSLTGTVPNLSGMTSLVKLKLANNNLTGGVPQASTLPPNMTWLIIDRNPFGGTIPDLSSLSRLRLLWLHSNQLTGPVPDGNNYPASLDDLNLRDNRLTGGIPDLSNLDNLTRLRLHNNSLSGEVPATLGDLDSLKQLWLHNEVDKGRGNNSFTSIAAGVGDLADTLIEIALDGNPWNANACVPAELANVAKNDYTEAGIEVCDGS